MIVAKVYVSLVLVIVMMYSTQQMRAYDTNLSRVGQFLLYMLRLIFSHKLLVFCVTVYAVAQFTKRSTFHTYKFCRYGRNFCTLLSKQSVCLLRYIQNILSVYKKYRCLIQAPTTSTDTTRTDNTSDSLHHGHGYVGTFLDKKCLQIKQSDTHLV